MSTMTRITPHVKPIRRFGEGIFATRPRHAFPCSIADMAWWAEQVERSIDRQADRRADEYQAQSRLDAGCIF